MCISGVLIVQSHSRFHGRILQQMVFVRLCSEVHGHFVVRVPFANMRTSKSGHRWRSSYFPRFISCKVATRRDITFRVSLLISLSFVIYIPIADMATPSTPASADFSSAPLKRTKIVLLGDQSVGKTSLITRCGGYLRNRRLLWPNRNLHSDIWQLYV